MGYLEQRPAREPVDIESSNVCGALHALWHRPSQSSVGCYDREERGLFQCVKLVPTQKSCNTCLSRGTTVLRGPHEDRSMLRIRFHGRGGQGMKTASRILGSAVFHAGYAVQDAPVYGAERRGALMAAFTRIAHTSILERRAVVSVHSCSTPSLSGNACRPSW